MNPKFRHLLILFAAAGLFSGLAARRFVHHPPSSRAASQNERTRAASGNSAEQIPSSAAQARTAPAFPPRHSTDTLETLAALDDAHLYARLALWLTDASEADIAAFWSGYSKKEDSSEEIAELIFLHWTRLDPQRAIAGAGKTDNEYYAWRAWACHDPQACLASAIATGPRFVEYVAEGIGRFHPDWLLKHIEEIPEDARVVAIRCMNKNGGKNPLETLTFLRRHDGEPSPATLKAFVREDPWGAIEWARQHPDISGDPFSDNDDALPTVIRSLAEESPDVLARIAERTPSGDAKLKMEAALFANLVKTDPAAALEQAKATTVPRTAAERYAAIGLGVVHSDPAQALQLAKDLLAACPGALGLTARIEYPNGNSSSSSYEIPGVSEFMSSLMVRQPADVMGMIASLPPELAEDQVESFSDQWIEQDLAGYANWVNLQANPVVREIGVDLIVGKLRESGHFQEAAEWASGGDLTVTDRLSGVLSRWQRQDPEGPANWLENSRLSPATKARIQSLLDLPR